MRVPAQRSHRHALVVLVFFPGRWSASKLDRTSSSRLCSRSILPARGVDLDEPDREVVDEERQAGKFRW
jgi:hypothetical protein